MRKPSACMSPAIKLHKFAFLVERQADHALQEALELSFSQCMILYSLKNNPGCSQQCIAKCRDLTEAAVSRQIEGLKRKKLILRRENERNRREHILKMTAKGNETLEKAMNVMCKTFDSAFSCLPAAERTCLERSLEKLLDHVPEQ